MTAAIVVLAATTIVLPFLLLRAWQQDRAQLMFLLASLSDQAADERRSLLNRIEPSTAQWAPSDQVLEAEDIPLDDDEAYNELSQLSREQLAERYAQAEVDA